MREGRNIKRQKMLEEGEKIDVPNPLPAISSILDPYVMAPPPAIGAQQPLDEVGKKKGRGRQQMVHTASHGTLPMAALEDAV